MFSKYLALSAIAATAQAYQNDHWAVIVSGSTGYENYRHQADACHAYQIMRRNGIPANQIIHMAADDIAHHPRNPFPGQLFNKPTNGPGWDVYAGC